MIEESLDAVSISANFSLKNTVWREKIRALSNSSMLVFVGKLKQGLP
jgi:hypothetical protein